MLVWVSICATVEAGQSCEQLSQAPTQDVHLSGMKMDLQPDSHLPPCPHPPAVPAPGSHTTSHSPILPYFLGNLHQPHSKPACLLSELTISQACDATGSVSWL